MSRFILDTDILTLFREGHSVVARRIAARREDELAITVISVEEQLSGWYALLRRADRGGRLAEVYQRLADTVRFLALFPIFSFTEPAIARHAQLAALRLNVGKMDLRIAAIVLEHGGTLVTRNARDFRRIPGLTIEDWTSENGQP